MDLAALLDLPGGLRARLVDALETGTLAWPPSEISLQRVLGPVDTEPVLAALGEMARRGASAPVAAAWLRSLGEAAARRPTIDLVWSGPEVPGVHARDTRQVFEQLIGEARRSLWISTFAYYDGPRAFEPLARRMDAVPGLEVVFLLNIQRRRGDDGPADELVRRFARRFWEHDWPGERRPRVYYDPRSLEEDGPTGVLHAKVLVADEEALFVTSANLTEAALDRNFELGLLLRDPTLARTAVTQLRALLDQGLLMPLPTA